MRARTTCLFLAAACLLLAAWSRWQHHHQPQLLLEVGRHRHYHAFPHLQSWSQESRKALGAAIAATWQQRRLPPPQSARTLLSAQQLRPPSPAAAAAAAAGKEAGAPAPVVKAVSDVKAGDSCICWTADWCTCDWQSCPFKPPAAGADLPSETAKLLFGRDVLPNLQLSADVQAARSAPPLSNTMLRRFNKRISTQLISPLYQFERGQHYLLEGARKVVESGGDSFKFSLSNADARGRAIQGVRTPLDMVRSPSLPYADMFDMPLAKYFMWVFPDYRNPYQETYELAVYLLQRYQGTGKQFFIGMWEGDHALRNPGNWGENIPPVIPRIESLQVVVQQKQKAVDAAKREYESCKNVYVWNYIEANLALSSVWNRGKISIVNYLVPTIDEPPLDYISYSAYEVLFRNDTKLQNLTAVFDYMAQRLPDKPGVPGPRVFLGEWAYPMFTPEGRMAWSLQESRQKGLYAVAVAIAWGSQFNQYWQLYSNHRLANGTGDRGFWLITPDRRDTPIWTNIKDYYAASDAFLRRFWGCFGGWPSDFTYRVWAVKTLMKLVNNASLPEPPVRELGATPYGRAVRVVADDTFGQLGPTITFRVSGGDATASAATSTSYVATSSTGAAPYTPPLVPQFLPGGGGDRGRCPIALPMLAPGAPAPPPAAKAVAAGGGNASAPANATNKPGGNGTTVNGTASGLPPPRPPRVQEEAGPVGARRATADKCGGWSAVTQRLKLGREACPLNYTRLTWQDVADRKSRAYTYGGIDRIGCANCQQKGLWPRFCLWRRTELPGWDAINCNQRESAGRSSVERNLDLAINLTRFWPASAGIPVPAGSNAAQLAPGPAELTPCDVFTLLRGRTLWVIGDSQMKGLYTALKCFMLEFWDLKQYAPTWNATTLAYLAKLPRGGAEAKCIHLPDSTRICQLKVLHADVFAEKPGPNETRWSTPLLELLQSHLAAPEDIISFNTGLWYAPTDPSRYFKNLVSLGQAYQATKATFPHLFFLETVKLHWPDPPGDQDAPRAANESYLEQCLPPEKVVFEAATASLRKVEMRDAAVAAIAAALAQLPPGTSSGSSSSGGSSGDGSDAGAVGTEGAAQRGNGMRLLRWLQHSQQEQHQRQWLAPLGRQLLAAVAGRGLLQQQQQLQQQQPRSAGPTEESPVFPLLPQDAPAATASNLQAQASGAITAAASPPTAPVGSSSSGSSSGSSSSKSIGGTGGFSFPLLQPTYADSPMGQAAKAAAEEAAPRPRRPSASSGSGSGSSGGAASPPLPAGSAGWSPPPPSPAAAAASAASALAPRRGAAAGLEKAAALQRAPGWGSVSLSPAEATDAVLSGLWRNQIARAVLRDTYDVSWVPIYNATVPTYWAHRHSPDTPDCIHYCNPGAPQNWLAKLMLAIAVKVPPLEGPQVADKRCLWGTEVVYDDGEKGFQ